MSFKAKTRFSRGTYHWVQIYKNNVFVLNNSLLSDAQTCKHTKQKGKVVLPKQK